MFNEFFNDYDWLKSLRMTRPTPKRVSSKKAWKKRNKSKRRIKCQSR